MPCARSFVRSLRLGFATMDSAAPAITGKIGSVVADVGKVDVSEKNAQAVEFFVAGQVVSAVACQNFVEDSEVIGNAPAR